LLLPEASSVNVARRGNVTRPLVAGQDRHAPFRLSAAQRFGPALAGIIGARRAWTALMTSAP
jgi:hypothetical protein